MAVVLTSEFARLLASIFSSLYVGLIKQNGEECFGGNYARQQIGIIDYCENSSYVLIQNVSPIYFPLATQTLAPLNNPITKVGLYSDATSDKLVAMADLPYSKPYLVQDQIIIPAYALVIRIPKTYT